MATFTADQLQQFIQTVTAAVINNTNAAPAAPENVTANPAATHNDPSALGTPPPCTLGTNKMTKLTKFEEWLEEVENRMEYIGNQSDKDKIILLKA